MKRYEGNAGGDELLVVGEKRRKTDKKIEIRVIRRVSNAPQDGTLWLYVPRATRWKHSYLTRYQPTQTSSQPRGLLLTLCTSLPDTCPGWSMNPLVFKGSTCNTPCCWFLLFHEKPAVSASPAVLENVLRPIALLTREHVFHLHVCWNGTWSLHAISLSTQCAISRSSPPAISTSNIAAGFYTRVQR